LIQPENVKYQTRRHEDSIKNGGLFQTIDDNERLKVSNSMRPGRTTVQHYKKDSKAKGTRFSPQTMVSSFCHGAIDVCASQVALTDNGLLHTPLTMIDRSISSTPRPQLRRSRLFDPLGAL